MPRPTAPSVAGDGRLACVLCEDPLPVPTAAGSDSITAVCARCWALTPADRRALLDRAMAQVLMRDSKRLS